MKRPFRLFAVLAAASLVSACGNAGALDPQPAPPDRPAGLDTVHLDEHGCPLHLLEPGAESSVLSRAEIGTFAFTVVPHGVREAPACAVAADGMTSRRGASLVRVVEAGEAEVFRTVQARVTRSQSAQAGFGARADELLVAYIVAVQDERIRMATTGSCEKCWMVSETSEVVRVGRLPDDERRDSFGIAGCVHPEECHWVESWIELEQPLGDRAIEIVLPDMSRDALRSWCGDVPSLLEASPTPDTAGTSGLRLPSARELRLAGNDFSSTWAVTLMAANAWRVAPDLPDAIRADAEYWGVDLDDCVASRGGDA